MNADQRISIDFGSTRTKVAYWNNETGEPALVEIGREQFHILPSVFYIPSGEKGAVLVGDEAIDKLEEDPKGIVIGVKKDIHKIGKIRLGSDRPAHDPVELVAHILQYIRDFCGENILATKPIACTLTVPVTFEERQINRLKEAATLAGFTDVDCIEEPVAAAMAWLKHSSKFLKSKHVIVCDVGGGTTDLALLNYENGQFFAHPEIETVGFDQGGNDVDQNVWERVFETLEDAKQLEYHKMNAAFRNQIRQVKELLLTDLRKSVSIDINGNEAIITRDIIQEESEALVKVVVDETKLFIEKCQRITGETDIPILLVGGGSRVPNLQERLEMSSDCTVYRWNFSDYATVLGAMYYRADSVPLEEPEPAPDITPTPLVEKKEEEPFSTRIGILLGSALVVICFFFSIYFLLHKEKGSDPDLVSLPPEASSEQELNTVTSAENTETTNLPAEPEPPTAEEISSIVNKAVKDALSSQIPEAIESVRDAGKQAAKDIEASVAASVSSLEEKKDSEASSAPKEEFEEFITISNQSRRNSPPSPAPSAEPLQPIAPQAQVQTAPPAAPTNFSPVQGGKSLLPQNTAKPVNDGETELYSQFYVEGTIAEKSGQHGKAHQWFLDGAENGDLYSMHKLGMSFINGKGVTRNYSEALRWFEKAANKGLADSQVYLGFVYEFGFGVRKDKGKARFWYEKAAAQGNQEAVEYLQNL